MSRPDYHAIRNAEMERELGPNHDAAMVDDCAMPERLSIETKADSNGTALFRWRCRCGAPAGAWLADRDVAWNNAIKHHRCGRSDSIRHAQLRVNTAITLTVRDQKVTP